MGHDGWFRPLRFRMVLAGILILVLSGCGSNDGGDKTPTDPEPTATVWPTVNDAGGSTTADASPPWQLADQTSGTPDAASGAASGTPGDSLPVEAPSSPGTQTSATATTVAPSDASTPDAAVTAAPTDSATPSSNQATETPSTGAAQSSSTPVSQDANPETGDGTSGPLEIPDIVNVAATPAASPGASNSVTSCSPDSVPDPTGETAFITTSDVNIRIGPGTDCDPAADMLSQGTLLTVTSGPVVRQGQEDVTWVRVEVDGIEGWVSTEFIAPDSE